MTWIGALLVLLAGAGLGHIAAGVRRRRTEELRRLHGALTVLESEVDAGTPLPRASQVISEIHDQPVTGLFQRFRRRLAEGGGCGAAAAWQEALSDVWDDTALTAADRRLLRELGVGLGSSHRVDQLKQLARIMRRLETVADRAEREVERSDRLFRYLGWLGGMALVILLI